MSITIKIKVTREIIDKSVQCNTGFCAFANALKDIFPNVIVSYRMIYPSGKANGPYRIPIPTEMRQFIVDFDRALVKSLIEPAEFDLEISDEILEQLVNLEEITRILENHSLLSIVS